MHHVASLIFEALCMQEKLKLAREVEDLNNTVFSKSFKAPSAWAEREVKYKMEKRDWMPRARNFARPSPSWRQRMHATVQITRRRSLRPKFRCPASIKHYFNPQCQRDVEAFIHLMWSLKPLSVAVCV